MKAFVSSFDDMLCELKRAEKDNARLANSYTKRPNEERRMQIIAKTNQKLKKLNSKGA
ncbi:hypothetical protein [Campylobacter suis]|uniref:50S ribosomal protein L29 n=1 Tax=Campylobacter suis TaxID=2790657 RepID=A0ABN7K6V0_9BACT|nr:hypothetical protein [Campylobacter suis]CAD7288264.1 hypothetical protein LMG8286_01232 [Campylobacter suis]